MIDRPTNGDMPKEEFRDQAAQVIDWIAGYLSDPGVYPVLAQVKPGEIRNRFKADAPEDGVDFGQILSEFADSVMPGITHWNHPSFFAYFAISGSGPGILAEMLAASLNVNAMVWRSSPAATEVEELAVDWLRQMLGLPDVFRGHLQDTASTSTLVALAVARESLDLGIRSSGMTGRELPGLRIYTTEQTHSSVDKAAIVLGLGLDGVRRIPTDSAFRMIPSELERAIREDRAAGLLPMAVVATIGTTSSTSIDPINRVADVCEREAVWLHIDGAYGGSAAVVPRLRPLFDGWEKADSIVVNPHKWMFVPIGCSALFFRDTELARRAFAVLPEYLTTPEGGEATNLMDYGVALGRRFRSLKLWATLQYFGREGIARRIEDHLRLAKLFEAMIEKADRWELMAPVPLSTVCFRYNPGSRSDEEMIGALNRHIMEEVNQSGRAFLSHTVLNGRFTLRLAIGNIRTTGEHIEDVWSALNSAAEKLFGGSAEMG